jgi:hypothetical protein
MKAAYIYLYTIGADRVPFAEKKKDQNNDQVWCNKLQLLQRELFGSDFKFILCPKIIRDMMQLI